MPALLSTVRNFPFGSLEETYRRIGQTIKHISVIWGDKDVTVPYRCVLCSGVGVSAGDGQRETRR